MQSVATRAEALRYPPLRAEDLFREAVVRDFLGEYANAEQILRRAILLAEASHHDHVVAESWLYLFSIEVARFERIAEAREYARYAASALERCADCGDLWASWHESMGGQRYTEGRLPEASEHLHLQLSIAMWSAQHPASSLELSGALATLGNVYGSMGQPKIALKLLAQSAQSIEQDFGPRHPSTGAVLHNLALQQQLGCENRPPIRKTPRREGCRMNAEIIFASARQAHRGTRSAPPTEPPRTG